MGFEQSKQALMHQAGSKPLLSASEEVRLAKRIEDQDAAAREKMIKSNIRLVMSLARAFRARGVPYADLVQEGTVGLVRAVDGFDYRLGYRFSTYAVWWIRRALSDAVTDAQVIRVPQKAKQQLAAINAARDELERSGPASDGAIAAQTALPESRVRALREAGRVTASLEQPLASEARTLHDVTADASAEDPSEPAIAREQSEQLWQMLSRLPKRHRAVLVSRYGLAGSRVLGHQEISGALGVSEQRSRQLEREALQRLRSISPAFRLAA